MPRSPWGSSPSSCSSRGTTSSRRCLPASPRCRTRPRAIGVFRAADLPRGTRDACLALWHLADPGNVGTLIRSADAFGAAVSLSAGSADPLSQKALRASAGAIFRVPLVPWDERPGRIVALEARGDVSLTEVELTRPVTILLGAERDGLPDDVLAACDAWQRSRCRATRSR